MLSPDKQAALEQRMATLGLREEDLIEKFILGSGKGGQKINKTASCVYIKHTPTGSEVKCQATRSRSMNRFLARMELCDSIERHRRSRAFAQHQAAAKARRRNRKRSRNSKLRSIADKRRISNKKSLRRRPTSDD